VPSGRRGCPLASGCAG